MSLPSYYPIILFKRFFQRKQKLNTTHSFSIRADMRGTSKESNQHYLSTRTQIMFQKEERMYPEITQARTFIDIRPSFIGTRLNN